jgi:hypothetical protein
MERERLARGNESNPFPPLVADPAPTSVEQLEALLRRKGWDLLDIEWACLDFLEKP